MSPCHKCGAMVAHGDRFCGICGSLQAELSATESVSEPEERQKPSAALPSFSSEPPPLQAQEVEPFAEATASPDIEYSGLEATLIEPAPPSAAQADVADPTNISTELSTPQYPGGGGTIGRERQGWTSPRAGRAGSTGGLQRSPSKQLTVGTLLNGRYEIVRRIGGGGMGAVYYAKDKNLGDAPRAVKEMIQSELDESQHEKAVGDFRRESMLL
ncbi:MAG TPA: hypothetical protein VM943_00920, partial [Pyrinomonadaceae bacterium]|nr:hypothetical protein [Pyrinomonadaceae bacterium]